MNAFPDRRAATSAVAVAAACTLIAIAPASIQAQASGLGESAQADTISVPERAFIASRIYDAVNTYFAHWDGVGDLDFDSVYRAYLVDALEVRSRREFSMATIALLARLRNSHTGFVDPELDPNRGHPYEFRVRFLGGEYVITHSERADLRVGDVIRAINDQPIEAFYAERRPFIAASTERYARRRLFDKWQSHLLPAVLRIALQDGRVVTIDRRNGGGRGAEVEVEGRWIVEPEVAYIKVPSWGGAQYQARALELLDEFKDARAMVVDVRGNTGGGTPVGFISALMDGDWRWWAESTPVRFGVMSFYAQSGSGAYSEFARSSLSWPAEVASGEASYRGQLAILVDAGCHSACEDFVMPFKDNGRAVIIGEATAGSTGEPYRESFGNGMAFGIGAKRERFPSGATFEGVGIEPDVEVVPTVASIREGQDLELAEALRRLSAGPVGGIQRPDSR